MVLLAFIEFIRLQYIYIRSNKSVMKNFYQNQISLPNWKPGMCLRSVQKNWFVPVEVESFKFSFILEYFNGP